MNIETARGVRVAPLKTPGSLTDAATTDIGGALGALLADVFALYIKTKNSRWHGSGPCFRDNHLMLDEQGALLLAMIDPIAERARKVGAATLRSIGHIARLQRVLDNDADFVEPNDMLSELRDDNSDLVERLRALHAVAMSIATSPPPVLWRPGSTEASNACGFCWKARAAADR